MATARNFSMSGINSGRRNRTMLNLCGIVVAILKMVAGRNFSMSGMKQKFMLFINKICLNQINTSPDNVPLCCRPHLIHHLVELILFLVPGLVFWVPSPKQNTKKENIKFHFCL